MHLWSCCLLTKRLVLRSRCRCRLHGRFRRFLMCYKGAPPTTANLELVGFFVESVAFSNPYWIKVNVP